MGVKDFEEALNRATSVYVSVPMGESFVWVLADKDYMKEAVDGERPYIGDGNIPAALRGTILFVGNT